MTHTPATLIRNRQHPERGGDTVEFILTLLVVVLIGGGLLALAGTLDSEVGKTGKTIFNWSGSVSSIPAGGGIGYQDPTEIADPKNGTAFAVYSDTDHSLDFYKRKAVPEVGTVFERKTVTEIYTGFETAHYYSNYDANGNQSNNESTTCPWWNHHADIQAVNVVDQGIKVRDMGFWFQFFTACKQFNIKQLDVSENDRWQHTFWQCKSVKHLDLSRMNVTKLNVIESMCTGCDELESVSLNGWKGSPTSTGIMFSQCPKLKTIDFGDIDWSHSVAFHFMFYNCYSLKLDCSSWNTSSATRHDDFALNAPGVIEPHWSN